MAPVKSIITKEIARHRSDLGRFGVKRLGIFGSVVRDEATPDSDVDFLVEFYEGQKTFDHYIDLAFYLEDMLQKKIDLVTLEALSDNLRSFILPEVEYIEV